MIEAARRVVGDNVTCILADIEKYPLPTGRYGAITSIAVLHHLSADEVLPRLAAALRPGGLLVVVGLPARDLLGEWHVELASMLLNPVLGAWFAALRALTGGSWYAHEATHDVMPVSDRAPLTTQQLAELVQRTLPGSRVRRLLFWRYLLVWRKP